MAANNDSARSGPVRLALIGSRAARCTVAGAMLLAVALTQSSAPTVELAAGDDTPDSPSQGTGEQLDDPLGATGDLPRDPAPPVLSAGASSAASAEPAQARQAAIGDLVPALSGPMGIPEIVLAAYHRAADNALRDNPECGVPWYVLAGIGRIESGHARGGRVTQDGGTWTRIIGPALDGSPGVAAIRATPDGTRWHGDSTWEHAVGPMQFLPGTWKLYAAHGANPHNVFDAADVAARYLCAGGGDLRDSDQLAAAIFRYNHSDAYVRTVLMWARAYAGGVVPTAPTDSPPVGGPAIEAAGRSRGPGEPPERPAGPQRSAGPGNPGGQPGPAPSSGGPQAAPAGAEPAPTTGSAPTTTSSAPSSSAPPSTTRSAPPSSSPSPPPSSTTSSPPPPTTTKPCSPVPNSPVCTP